MIMTMRRLPCGLYSYALFKADKCSGHIGLTVPDVKAALARFDKYGVGVFKPLGVATNATILVPDGMTPIVPGSYQIAMIRLLSAPLIVPDPDGYFIELVPQNNERH